jgi:phosphatidate phosphatase APP1
MTTWKNALQRLTNNAEQHFDSLKHRLVRRLSLLGPVMILPYRGFGDNHEIYLRGRVLKDKNIKAPMDNDTTWRNLLSAYKRFHSLEVPGIRVRASFKGTQQEAVTDAEGYFEFQIRPEQPLAPGRAWHEVELELIDPGIRDNEPIRATGHVLTPTLGSDFGVISDVDDTILRTDATSLLRMARLTFLGNARTRLPFEGVAAFYRALQSGPESSLFNPIFYVSSSPWNLYDLLVDFCSIQGIPKGPFLLRDFGIRQAKFLKNGHHAHKTEQIRLIMETCAELPFILIGDSGQHDPEIYLDVIREYPGRILACYIRDVSIKTQRDEAVQAIADQAKALGVEMLLVADTAAAAEHAVQRGFIDPDTLPDIYAEKAEDSGKPDDLEQLLDTP